MGTEGDSLTDCGEPVAKEGNNGTGGIVGTGGFEVDTFTTLEGGGVADLAAALEAFSSERL